MKTELVLRLDEGRGDGVKYGQYLISKYIHEGWTVNDEKQFFLWLEWVSVRVEGTSKTLKMALDCDNLVAIEDVFVRNRHTMDKETLSMYMKMFIGRYYKSSPCAYYGIKQNLMLGEEPPNFVMLALNKIRYRPTNFIGVGYRDSGNARNPATDGSPRWQEVATQYGEPEPWSLEYATKVRDQSIYQLLLQCSNGRRTKLTKHTKTDFIGPFEFDSTTR